MRDTFANKIDKYILLWIAFKNVSMLQLFGTKLQLLWVNRCLGFDFGAGSMLNFWNLRRAAGEGHGQCMAWSGHGVVLHFWFLWIAAGAMQTGAAVLCSHRIGPSVPSTACWAAVTPSCFQRGCGYPMHRNLTQGGLQAGSWPAGLVDAQAAVSAH